jgi:hypothetical protein
LAKKFVAVTVAHSKFPPVIVTRVQDFKSQANFTSLIYGVFSNTLSKYIFVGFIISHLQTVKYHFKVPAQSETLQVLNTHSLILTLLHHK